MILHISKDEKFIKSAITIFDYAAPGINKYVIWTQDNQEKIPSFFYHFKVNNNNHIESFPKKQKIFNSKSNCGVEKNVNIEFAYYGTEEFFKKIGDLSKYKAIIFHSLIYNHAKLAVIIKKVIDVPMVWIPFGYEVHNMLPEFKTKDFHAKVTNAHQSKSLKDVVFLLLNRFKANKIREGIKIVNYCAISINDEFELYKTKINFNAKLIWFSYYPLDVLIKNKNVKPNGNNILIGNSSTPTNNHIESFELLSKLNLENRNIIVPLSYGNKKYGDIIVKKGKSYFGDEIRFIRTFLPINEYNEILSSCEVVIMNHTRQQAFGNILSALSFGATLYLNEKSSIYSYLNRIGIFFYSTNSLKDITNMKIPTLNEHQLYSNQKIISNLYSFNNITLNVKQFIEEEFKA